MKHSSINRTIIPDDLILTQTIFINNDQGKKNGMEF